MLGWVLWESVLITWCLSCWNQPSLVLYNKLVLDTYITTLAVDSHNHIGTRHVKSLQVCAHYKIGCKLNADAWCMHDKLGTTMISVHVQTRRI